MRNGTGSGSRWAGDGRVASSGSDEWFAAREGAAAKHATAPPLSTPAIATAAIARDPACRRRFCQRGLAEASPFAAGFFALGFCELFAGLFWFVCGFELLLAGLPPSVLEFGLLDAAPCPLTVMRSLTRRLPAKELAMRCAVCFSLPVCTAPPSSMVLSVTFTLSESLCRVGSFCSAFCIWLCSVAVSLMPTPVVVMLGAAGAPAFAPIALGWVD